VPRPRPAPGPPGACGLSPLSPLPRLSRGPPAWGDRPAYAPRPSYALLRAEGPLCRAPRTARDFPDSARPPRP